MYEHLEQEQAGVTLLPPQRAMTPEEKASEVKCGCDDDGQSRVGCPYLYDLEFQLAQSFYWSGSFLKDLLFFICNWHPFLGMFFSHPRHPWAKRDRILTFVVSCSMTMLPSALFVQWGRNHGETILSSVAIFFTITLPVMVIEIALYWLAVGGVFCKGTSLECCTQCVRCLKTSCFCVSFVFSFAMLAISYLALGNASPTRLVYPFVLSRLQSYITWLPLFILLPCIGFVHTWLLEKKALLHHSEVATPPSP